MVRGADKARPPIIRPMDRAFRVVGVLVLAVALGACSGGEPSGAAPAASAETATDALNRGIEFQKQGKYYEAGVAYFQALAKDQANKYAFYNLGLIAQTRKANVVSESYYRIALEIDPKFPEALYNLAVLLQNKGEFAESIDLYNRVIALEPNNAGAHFNLGLALRSVGKRAEGDAELAKARQLDPQFVPPAASATPRPSPTR